MPYLRGVFSVFFSFSLSQCLVHRKFVLNLSIHKGLQDIFYYVLPSKHTNACTIRTINNFIVRVYNFSLQSLFFWRGEMVWFLPPFLPCIILVCTVEYLCCNEYEIKCGSISIELCSNSGIMKQYGRYGFFCLSFSCSFMGSLIRIYLLM